MCIIVYTILYYTDIYYRYGLLVRHWTMRYEAKHAYFKGLAQSMGNFINLPYSLAMRHQQLKCYLSMNGGELPGVGLDVGPDLLQSFIQVYIYIITIIVLVHAGSTMDPMSMETKELGCAVSSAFE